MLQPHPPAHPPRRIVVRSLCPNQRHARERWGNCGDIAVALVCRLRAAATRFLVLLLRVSGSDVHGLNKT